MSILHSHQLHQKQRQNAPCAPQRTRRSGHQLKVIMLTSRQFAFTACPECTHIFRGHQGATQFSGHTPNVNDAYDHSCSIMHLVLPPSADLYAQVIYAHPLGSIYAFIRYALYACSFTRLFTQLRVDTNVLNSDYLRMYKQNPANQLYICTYSPYPCLVPSNIQSSLILRLFMAILSSRRSKLGRTLEEIVSFWGKFTILKIDPA